MCCLPQPHDRKGIQSALEAIAPQIPSGPTNQDKERALIAFQAYPSNPLAVDFFSMGPS